MIVADRRLGRMMTGLAMVCPSVRPPQHRTALTPFLLLTCAETDPPLRLGLKDMQYAEIGLSYGQLEHSSGWVCSFFHCTTAPGWMLQPPIYEEFVLTA